MADQDLPDQATFQTLTTTRNRDLITSEEQQRFHQTVVVFFGMSVGSNAALSWMQLSRANKIIIVDHDTLTATNLNRIEAAWTDLDRLKTEIIKDRLQLINPFADIITVTDTSADSIRDLFASHTDINVVVEEIDDFKSKVLIRQLAREHHLPLISAADVGDNVMLDIERYDDTPQPQLFNGRIENVESIDFDSLSPDDRKKLIIQLVTLEHHSPRMLSSLAEIGKTLETWPQLGPTARMTGGIVALTIKRILLRESAASGRYYLGLDLSLV